VEITSFSFDIKQRLGKFNVALDCLKYLWVCSAGIVLERKLSFETNEATSSTCFSFFRDVMCWGFNYESSNKHWIALKAKPIFFVNQFVCFLWTIFIAQAKLEKTNLWSYQRDPVEMYDKYARNFTVLSQFPSSTDFKIWQRFLRSVYACNGVITLSKPVFSCLDRSSLWVAVEIFL